MYIVVVTNRSKDDKVNKNLYYFPAENTLPQEQIHKEAISYS